MKLFEKECLRNYFYRKGSFSGLSEAEPKLYQMISQLKHRGFKSEDIDSKAPGGMQTPFYNIIGFRRSEYDNSPTGYIESYAVHLAMLKFNKCNLDSREEKHLADFMEYYGFKDLNKFYEACKIFTLPYVPISDILLTHSIYTYFFENKYDADVKRFIVSLKLNNITDILSLDISQKIKLFIEKKLLPKIEEVDESQNAVITDSIIQIPANRKINWIDLMCSCVLGLPYRGLYRPRLQMGAYMKYKLTANFIELDPFNISIDDVYRRMYNIDSFVEFWGISPEGMPEISYKKGYLIYPFLNLDGGFAPKHINKLYCILFADDNLVVTDSKVFEYIYDKLPNVQFTDTFYSKIIDQKIMCACAPLNGVLTPLFEILINHAPKDGLLYNLTSNNLGLA